MSDSFKERVLIQRRKEINNGSQNYANIRSQETSGEFADCIRAVAHNQLNALNDKYGGHSQRRLQQALTVNNWKANLPGIAPLPTT